MKKLKHIFSKLVFFGGLAAIGVLAVPAAILFGMIALIRAATDLITQKLEKKKLTAAFSTVSKCGSFVSVKNQKL